MNLRPALLFLVATAATAFAESRVWTSTDGRTLTGVYLSATSEAVTVRLAGFRESVIPLERLSAPDREYVAGRLAAANSTETAEAEAKAYLTYGLSDGSDDWDAARKRRIVDAMDAAVRLYNQHGKFKKHVTANNSPGTPTADANYDGWINFGGTINTRVALHEISHTLGIGTHPEWHKNIKDGKWTGKHALALVREFDGPDTTLSADRMHFWPYGLNFDNESSRENDIRHVKMVAAMRRDMGLD